MNLGEQLFALRRDRFPELQVYCGKTSEPGVFNCDEWADWSEFYTSGAQLRIEDYLDRLGVRSKSVLNVGIGSSGLAKRFARDSARLFGITVIAAEVEKAASLRLSNYRAILHNKYSGSNDSIPAGFDFIVDDGPTTFCCCLTHLKVMLDFYASKLAENGQVVFERKGLGWTIDVPDTHKRWGFSFGDLAAVAPLCGLTAFQIDEDIFVLARSRPTSPTLASLTSYYFRRAGGKLSRGVRAARKVLQGDGARPGFRGPFLAPTSPRRDAGTT